MSKIPTAEELSKKYTRLRSAVALKDLSDFAIEFAKLHVEAALKEASKKAKCCDDAIVDLGHTITEAYVEENSILNAYPLTNIK